MLILSFAVSMFACDTEQAVEEDSSFAAGWADYQPTEPTEEMKSWLNGTPTHWSTKTCFPFEEGMNVEESELTVQEDGSLEVCFWDQVAGAVPEGEVFGERSECNIVRTQGPSWFVPPVPLIEHDEEALNDEDFARELEWAREQGWASGCACCHSSQTTGYASRWDYDAPGIWTDTLPMSGVVMGAGLADEHNLLGFWDASDNFGFDREHAIIPTTDIDRMQAFFQKEFERRGGTEKDIQDAKDLFLRANFQIFEEASECISPFEGVDENGVVHWNGAEARQIYIQEVDADNPGFPPNFDLPDKTAWALYVEPTAEPIEQGTVKIGEQPAGSLQTMPADGSYPVLEAGKTYKLFVNPDFMLVRLANCTFTMPEIQ